MYDSARFGVKGILQTNEFYFLPEEELGTYSGWEGIREFLLFPNSGNFPLENLRAPSSTPTPKTPETQTMV